MKNNIFASFLYFHSIFYKKLQVFTIFTSFGLRTLLQRSSNVHKRINQTHQTNTFGSSHISPYQCSAPHHLQAT